MIRFVLVVNNVRLGRWWLIQVIRASYSTRIDKAPQGIEFFFFYEDWGLDGQEKGLSESAKSLLGHYMIHKIF